MKNLRKLFLATVLIMSSISFTSCIDESEKLEENAKMEEQFSGVNFSEKDEEKEDRD